MIALITLITLIALILQKQKPAALLRHGLFFAGDAAVDAASERGFADFRSAKLKLFSGGSFFSSFLCGSDGCLSFCSSSCCRSFLLCHFLSLSLVLCYLSLEAVLSLKLLGTLYRCAELVSGLLLLSLPSIETTLSLSFVKRTLLDTTLEMLHEKHALVREDVADSIGGLCANVYPIQSTLEVQSYCSRISVRIIRTYPFNKFTISWCPAIGDNNRIERIVLATMTLQSDFCCH